MFWFLFHRWNSFRLVANGNHWFIVIISWYLLPFLLCNYGNWYNMIRALCHVSTHWTIIINEHLINKPPHCLPLLSSCSIYWLRLNWHLVSNSCTYWITWQSRDMQSPYQQCPHHSLHWTIPDTPDVFSYSSSVLYSYPAAYVHEL